MLFVAALLLIIARFLSVWTGTTFPVDLVSSNSMSPSLIEGDVVAWTPVKMEDIRIGDVIVFKSYVHWPDEKIVVHRVVNITRNSRNEILLETKGDKNKWTDQAGPHIPEPYIREDHVVGRVISIGQQPLKIPLIGYLGVWINQGLDLISQPSSSKGSLGYIGIFAPLTISAVILVLLIFILPEKAKTFKEKLRLYIFGPRPLHLKKTMLSFLIAYIVFLSMIHMFAYDSVTASVGVDADSPDSGINFGRLQPGKESFPKELPVVNPGTMPVKGIIFGRGNMSEFVTKKTFELERGCEKSITLKAVVPNGTKKGSYEGEIMVYSSPFWMMFSDELIQNIYNWNAEATVFILDLLSAVVLTLITMLLLIIITFIGEKTTVWSIDRSWLHASKILLKKGVKERLSIIKKEMKQWLIKNINWIMEIDLTEDADKNLFSSIGKPFLASLIVTPFVFFITDQISAMIIYVITAGLTAYLISCKIRSKIVLTSLIAITIAIVQMLVWSNIIIFEKNVMLIDMIALSIGVTGIYILLLTLFLIPLAIVSWFITRFIRNVKERKDPLLSLEGTCDL